MESTDFDLTFKRANTRKLSRRAALVLGSSGIATVALASAGLSSASWAQESTPEASTTAVPPVDLSNVAPLDLTGARLAAFEAHIATKLAELAIPGASVAVVQKGEVVFLQGFGVREMERSEPVTADTLFRIGSVTKSFSSLLAATLVDDGQLSWETPLVHLLPDFAVSDPDLTPRLTVADSFGAASGLPRRDWEIVFNGHSFTPEQIVAEMARLPLTAPYGTTYQYSDQMVAAGGWAAAMADGGDSNNLGRAYEIALQARILRPIGMVRSTLSLKEAIASNDFAVPHAADISGALHDLPLLADDAWVVTVAPSGGLWSSASDMARYLQTGLTRGIGPNGNRIVSAANLERTWAPGVSLGEAAGHYGLGWVISEYNGQRLIFHAGATLGFHSSVAFLPDADLGLVVLTNASVAMAAPLNRSIAFRLFEMLFEQPAAFDALQAPALLAASEERSNLMAQLGEIDLLTVAPYLGRYDNPSLGEASLMLQAGQLIYAIGGFRSELRPRVGADGEITEYLFLDPPIAFAPPELSITLEPDLSGRPRLTMKVAGEPGVDDLLYPFLPIGTP